MNQQEIAEDVVLLNKNIAIFIIRRFLLLIDARPVVGGCIDCLQKLAAAGGGGDKKEQMQEARISVRTIAEQHQEEQERQARAEDDDTS